MARLSKHYRTLSSHSWYSITSNNSFQSLNQFYLLLFGFNGMHQKVVLMEKGCNWVLFKFLTKTLHLCITLLHQTHKLAINLKSLIVFEFQRLCENWGPPDWILSNFETDSWKFTTVKRIILPKLGSDEIVISHTESYDVTADLLPIYRTNFTYISMHFVFLIIDKFGVWMVLR